VRSINTIGIAYFEASCLRSSPHQTCR